MSHASRLQQDLAERILDLARDDGLAVGAHLNESVIARRLGVSRTPVRAAFARLEERGLVRRHPNRGLELIRPPGEAAGDAAPSDPVELALIHLAHERESGALADEFSEQEVMRRYGLGRPEAKRLLARLAELDMVERKPGYGWRFLQEPRDPRVHDERYRFRLLIEPMALLEPGFVLEAAWIEEMRRQHRATLAAPWRETSAISFFEMNAAFHEGLAAASGNRFIHSAIRRQNQLRRLSNYDWVFGFERVEVNCREHLQMLDSIEAGDLEVAAAQMRRHLQRASRLRRADGLD
jgi:DNA-binding GntR family transcriptional regulator